MKTVTRRRFRTSARVTRLAEARAGDLPTSERPPGPRAVAVAALWSGLVTGLLELGLTLALKPLHADAPGLFRENRNILWIIPLVNLVVFAVCGGLVVLAAWLRPRRAARLAGFLPCFVSIVTLLLTVRGL